jgi:ketosteroid isomerase-like protein
MPESWQESRKRVNTVTTNLIYSDTSSIGLDDSERTLRSVLTALSEGRFSEAVSRFDDHFTFIDRALDLEFMEKERLTEFFQKARELFPDTALEVVSLMESGDHAIAEWKLTATQTVPYGSISYRFPVALHGSTIVRVEHGRIVQWSDYYDRSSSRRTGLASYFTEWIEY